MLRRLFFILTTPSDYAKGIAKSFREAYKGEIVADETFVAGDTDFQAALTKMKGKEFDAIVVPGYYTEDW